MAWTTYKGVSVPDVTTSDAGTYLTDDVRSLADRVVYTAVADPTATNDTTQGFAPGSEWLNTSTLQTWQCISAASGAAVWAPLVQVAAGEVIFNGSSGAGAAQQVSIPIAASGTVGLTVAGAGGQTANLAQFENSSSTVLSAINAAGNFTGSSAGFTGSLSGDVTGTQSATVVATVGGSTAANIHSAEQAANAATSADTASTIVKRDGSGNFSAGTITAASVTGLGTPVNPGDAANKSYVDASVQGLQIKSTANLATAAALPANTYNNGSSGVGATLTANSNGALTVDSVAVTAGMLVLVKNESAAANNGLYVVTAAGGVSAQYVLTRSLEMQSSGEFSGAFVPVDNQGTANANTLWLANPSGTVTVGTTAIPFTQLNGATDLVAGSGISISGNTVSVSSSYAGQTSINTLGTIVTGTWNGTAVAIANGGTGATTANAALNALLPSQSGNSGSILTTNGTNASWVPGVGPVIQTISYASTITPVGSNAKSIVNLGSLTGNITINAPSGTPSDGNDLTFRLVQDATGGRTITWNAAFAFGTDITSALVVTTASSKQELKFIYNATDSTWRAMAIARGF